MSNAPVNADVSEGLLFPVPESLSPRRAWMKRHGVTVYFSADFEEQGPWFAWSKEDENTDGYPKSGHCSEGETADEAAANLALRKGLKLWNEENLN